MDNYLVIPFGKVYNIIRQFQAYMTNSTINLWKNREKSIKDINESLIMNNALDIILNNGQGVAIPKSFVIGENATAFKLLTYILHKFETELFNRDKKKLIKRDLTITKKELEDLKIIPKDTNVNFIETISNLYNKINIFLYIGKEGEESVKYHQLIAIREPKEDITEDSIKIWLDDELEWFKYFPQTTITPKYSFELSANSFILNTYIMCNALKHSKEISNDGGFQIPMREVQKELGLPDEDEDEEKADKVDEDTPRVIPTGKVCDIIRTFCCCMTSGMEEKEALKQWKDREKSIKYIKDDGSSYVIRFKVGKETQRVIIPKSFANSQMPFIMLQYILHRLETELLSRETGKLNKDTLKITKDELLRLGVISKDTDFFEFAKNLYDDINIFVGYKVNKDIDTLGCLIIGFNIVADSITIEFNNNLNWTRYFPDTTILPNFFFQLAA